MDATTTDATTTDRQPGTEPASSLDISGYTVRTRFLIMIALAIAPWAIAIGIALLLR